MARHQVASRSERELLRRTLVSSHDACLRDNMVKLERARGGCLGIGRRRRTWTAAISFGEPLTGIDPEISESGNRMAMSHQPMVNS